jgi:hypothetical protein
VGWTGSIAPMFWEFQGNNDSLEIKIAGQKLRQLKWGNGDTLYFLSSAANTGCESVAKHDTLLYSSGGLLKGDGTASPALFASHDSVLFYYPGTKATGTMNLSFATNGTGGVTAFAPRLTSNATGLLIIRNFATGTNKIYTTDTITHNGNTFVANDGPLLVGAIFNVGFNGVGGRIDIGTKTLNLNGSYYLNNICTTSLGSSIIRCGSIATAYSSDTLANNTINLGSASIVDVAGNVNISKNVNLLYGTSELQLTGTGACQLTSSGKAWYDITMNKTLNGVTLMDSLQVKGDLTLTDGTFAQSTKRISVEGDIEISTADTVTIDTCVYAGGDFTIGATAAKLGYGANAKLYMGMDQSVITTNEKNLPHVSLAATTRLNGGGTVARMTLAPGDSAIMEANRVWTFTAVDSVDWSGTSAESRTAIVSSTPEQRSELDLPGTRGFTNLYMRDQCSDDTIRCLSGCKSGGGNYCVD